MGADASLKIIGHWSISPLCLYVVLCLVFALTLRIVFASFRAWAVQRSDFPGADTNLNVPRTFREGFVMILCGFSRQKEHADLWLPFIIGFAELFSYPVLIKLEAYEIIGWWLLLKTAGQWSGWTHSRTSFNRFLLANICNIAISYGVLSWFVHAR